MEPLPQWYRCFLYMYRSFFEFNICTDQNKVILVNSGALNKLYALYRSTSNDVVYYAKGALFAMGIELDRPQQ